MKRKGILIIIVSVIVGFYFYNRNQKKKEFQNALQEIRDERIKYRGNDESKPYLSNDQIAYAAQLFVEKTLKVPSTANFPGLFKSSVIKKNSNTYKVSSYVDSENGFGAIIRSTYVVELRQNEDGEISLVDIKISD